MAYIVYHEILTFHYTNSVIPRPMVATSRMRCQHSEYTFRRDSD